jgi:hypothetical protein
MIDIIKINMINMKEEHVSFEILSDLYDNELSESSKSEVLTHLKECEHCKKEFETLGKMLTLITLATDVKLPDEFTFNVINIFKGRKAKKRHRAYYYAPVAAAIIAILGVTLFFYEKSHNISNKNIAQLTTQKPVSKVSQPISKAKSLVSSMQPKVQSSASASVQLDNRLNETQRIISIISDSNARILNILENSIEGEISEEEFPAFRDSLENRRIVFHKVRPNESLVMNQWMRGLETVAFSDSYEFDDVETDSPPIIRFRIYKKY